MGDRSYRPSSVVYLRSDAYCQHVLVHVTRGRVAMLVVIPMRAVAGPAQVDVSIVRRHADIVAYERGAICRGLPVRQIAVEGGTPVAEVLGGHTQAARGRE